jgi:hypothetical protein
MEAKGWGGLDTRQWWFGVLVIAGPTLVAAVSAGRTNIVIIAAGIVTWAFAEWIQHPYQQFQRNGHIGDKYNRVWSVHGAMLDLVGIFVVAIGIVGALREF